MPNLLMQNLIDFLCETFQLLSGVLVKLMAILFYCPTMNKQKYEKYEDVWAYS